ncbi:MAG: DnaJ domain-containing protein, partial [Betaproteobacteria bacterium]
MKSSPQRSHYQLLDIAEDAEREAIALAYQRTLEALARDPDADPDARTQLRRAYEVLTDPMQRMTYDLSLRRNEPQITYEAAKEDDGSLLSRLWDRLWVKALVLVLTLVAITIWMRSGKHEIEAIS